ncbi:MAG: hypothetical protein U9R19_14005 [Bacteroidota bacterium]|nr:hypothetical protein [Bacteroidota bacterium]
MRGLNVELIEDMLDEYCNLLHYEKQDLLTSRNRPRPQVRMSFAKVIMDSQYVTVTYSELGRILGGLTYSTLSQQIRAIEGQLKVGKYPELLQYIRLAEQAVSTVLKQKDVGAVYWTMEDNIGYDYERR